MCFAIMHTHSPPKMNPTTLIDSQTQSLSVAIHQVHHSLFEKATFVCNIFNKLQCPQHVFIMVNAVSQCLYKTWPVNSSVGFA